MSLLEYQLVIGRCLRAAGAEASSARITDQLQDVATDHEELAALVHLIRSPGFRMTQRVQRSWCLSRTEAAAQLTLSVLQSGLRRQLIEDWVAAGGGTAFDPASEAEAFLELIASRLVDPSHELTVCRTEQATLRASAAALDFTPPDPTLLDNPDAVLRAGKAATLVRFLTEPQRLFEAIEAKRPLPALSGRCFPLLFAPGLPLLFRVANNIETAIWDKLAHPIPVRLLKDDDETRRATEQLFAIGAADLRPETR
jgi:hypothetical protein